MLRPVFVSGVAEMTSKSCSSVLEEGRVMCQVSSETHTCRARCPGSGATSEAGRSSARHLGKGGGVMGKKVANA